MRTRQFSLAAIVATTLVIVTTIVLGSYSMVTYNKYADDQRYDFRRGVALQTRESAVALALPLWNIDRPQIDRVIAAMAQPYSLYAISVTAAGETHGLIHDANGKLVPWNGKGEPAGMVVGQEPITLSGKDLGSVRVLFTPRYLEEGLWVMRLRSMASIAAIDVLLILVIYLLLFRTVVSPLMEIERYAILVSKGEHRPANALPPLAASELVNLQASLQTMIRLLDQRYVELQEEMIRRFESEERFRTIFDSVNDTIIIYDPESGAILDVNARFCEVFGYTREEALEHFSGSFASGVGPYSSDFAIEKIRGLGINEHFIMEWQARRRDGALIWFETSVRAAMIGGMRHVITVARDITRRKEMEEELRRSETMSMMGSLVAGVAHEVRNPLFGIAATIDAFEAEFGGGDGAAEYMTTLRNDVARLSRLMNDLLEYGRPQQLVRHIQSIEPVIAEAVRVCTPRARERRIEIKQEIEGPLPFVAIDADRVLQVLKNVVENAVEFSAAGESVAITAHAQRNGASSIVFTIADRGPGFRREDLPHIFEPFFTRRTGGSGLGLAIVQKIVTEHGGTIEAKNGTAGGAMIEIRLPITGSA
jgi:PAS domain S-box-containing protein